MTNQDKLLLMQKIGKINGNREKPFFSSPCRGAQLDISAITQYAAASGRPITELTAEEIAAHTEINLREFLSYVEHHSVFYDADHWRYPSITDDQRSSANSIVEAGIRLGLQLAIALVKDDQAKLLPAALLGSAYRKKLLEHYGLD